MDPEIITISADVDVISARLKARRLAGEIGISGSDLTLLATAISEIARNIVQYAGSGEIEFRSVFGSGRRGLAVIARDQGPGIDDIHLAMQDGFTTSRGMGMGLPGAKRLMDHFEITSETGKGTIVRMVKWER